MNPQMSGQGGFPNTGQYAAENLRQLSRSNSQAMMSNLMVDGNMGDTTMLDGQTLDGLMSQNMGEQQRRSTYHPQMSAASNGSGNARRRVSMLEFGSLNNNDLDGFQFSPSPMVQSPTTNTLPNGGGIARRRMEARQAAQRRQSSGNLTLDSQYHDASPSMANMAQSPMFQQPLPSEPINLDAGNDFVGDMDMSMDLGNGMNSAMFDEMSGMAMYQPTDFGMAMNSMSQGANPPMMDMPTESAPSMGNNAEQTIMEKMPQMKMSDSRANNTLTQPLNFTATAANTQSSMQQNGTSHDGDRPSTKYNSSMQQQMKNNPAANSMPTSQNNFSTGAPMANVKSQSNLPQYLNAYSSTGFDMLGVLMRVATRPRAQINIGAVDMSCAFVVCDVTQHDIPIVYCSEMFERLTGYSRHEILGRNCRFLQAPDGKVQAGVKRNYVDDSAVLHLKNMINLQSEAQISLINYRKGGQPFMNLLTMIPIAWDTEDIKFYVGFQVDLVEQPTSITNKNPGRSMSGWRLFDLTYPDGSYSINYQRGLLPTFVFNSTPEMNRGKESEVNHPLERDEVSMVLSTLGGTGDSDVSKRIWDKVLLEGTDDVLHVLSLKGLFLYLSQASKKILEYEPHELVGTALSSVCHPSDIVPVTRELKDTAPGATVNVVFRIRRKFSGYTWFESHGSLHTEQGKGKKCIILVGRERPVYALRRNNLVNANMIGENELWTKMSTSGMFLFVSSHARSLLDRQPDELRGTSAQSLMRSESKAEFNKMLELARVGIKSTFKHDIQNRRGQTLHAQTTLYPGDALEGSKPTFLVAQTKLLKMARTTSSMNKQNSGASGTSDVSNMMSGSSQGKTPVQSGNGLLPNEQTPRQSSTPTTNKSQPFIDGIVTAAGANALPIGSQHQIIASEDNVFDELKTTRSTSWQFELRQMEKRNRVLAEEMQSLMSNKKKRKRRKGLGQLQKDCVNCHTRSTPEWRRGPSGNRDLCNSCGLRWAKQVSIPPIFFLLSTFPHNPFSLCST